MIVIFCAFIYIYVATVHACRSITAKVSAAEGDEYQIPLQLQVKCDEYTASWLAHLTSL